MTETILDSPSIIFGLLLLLALVMVYSGWKKSKSGRRPSGSRGPSKGASILDITRKLQAVNAQWPKIISELNPRNDPKATQLLLELRGPHMFAPHTALNIIVDACRSTLKTRPDASLCDILRNACESMKKVTRYGD